MKDIERFVLELIAAQNKDERSFKSDEIARMMSPDHRQKLLDLGFTAIRSSDTPIVWWAYLLERCASEEGSKALEKIQDMIQRRLETGRWT